LPGITYNSSIGGRYGYQGQFAENDKEINEQFFELRNYDPLLARFSSIDPYEQFHSPYLAMGNNHPNQVDQNGGITSWQGSLIGAVIGIVGYGIHDLTSDGQHKFDKPLENYFYWGLAGAVAGGIVGGLASNHFNFDGAEFWGHKLKHRRYSGTTGNFPWYFEKAHYMRLTNISMHFSTAFRIGNMVLWDIRFNSTLDNTWQGNFPGRH
jgi:RHS repeat-associated protein